MLNIYGQTHSPWVQAVLLGVHDRGIPYELTTSTPLELLFKSGVMMPAAKADGSDWRLESAELLAQAGFSSVSEEDRRHLNSAWWGVIHRVDSANEFFGAFSRAGDPHPDRMTRLWKNYWRSFSSLYFFLLMRYRIMTHGYRDPENFGDQFDYWENRLTDCGSAYIGGASPDTTDFLLFGIIQCHCSIPVPPVNAILNDSRLSRLREWLTRMQMRFSNYPYLYSGPLLEPKLPGPLSAGYLDRSAFFLGLGSLVTFFPITVPLIFWLIARVPRG